MRQKVDLAGFPCSERSVRLLQKVPAACVTEELLSELRGAGGLDDGVRPLFPDNGRGGTRAGRITPREYPISARIELDIRCNKPRLRRNLQRLQGELHRVVEDRARDVGPEEPDVAVRILHVRRDHHLRAVARRHPGA